MQPPLKKVIHFFLTTPSQSWGPVKPPLFENLVGGSSPPPGERGVHTMKQQFYNHRQSFKCKKHKNDTTLSSYLWNLKQNNNHILKLTWSVVRFVPSYYSISKKCLLCLYEKLLILSYLNPAELLNKRSELMVKYYHENKVLLIN